MKAIIFIPTFAYPLMNREEAISLYKKEVAFLSKGYNDPVLKDEYKKAVKEMKENHKPYIYERDDTGFLFVFAFTPDKSIKMHPQYIKNLLHLIEGLKEKGVKGVPFPKRIKLAKNVFSFISSYKEVMQSEKVKKIKEALVLDDGSVVYETKENIMEPKEDKMEDKIKNALNKLSSLSDEQLKAKLLNGIEDRKVEVVSSFLAGLFTVIKTDTPFSDFAITIQYTHAAKKLGLPFVKFKEMSAIIFYMSLTSLKDYIEMSAYEYQEITGTKVRIHLYKQK